MDATRKRTWEDSPLSQARRIGLFTQDEMAERLSITKQTLLKYEKHPEKMKLELIGDAIAVLPRDGGDVLRRYVEDFLSPS